MINHVMIVGYSIIGKGIALLFARGGHKVTVLSRNSLGIEIAPKGIEVISKLPEDPPDLIV